MDEAELNAIRQARLAELQKQGAGGQAGNTSDDSRYSMLSQILEPSARERLSRVRIVRPDRAEAVEKYITKLAASGAITRKLAERDIVGILDNLSRDEKKHSQNKIVFERKNNNFDSDEEEDDFFD